MKNHTSIGHLTIREQQALLSLKNKIIALCKPLIIYLVGSNSSMHLTRNCLAVARNDSRWHFSCDLLLVLPEGTTLPGNAEQELKSTGKDYGHIHLIAHPIDFIERQLKEHSLFFCWVQRRAIVLYEKDNSCRQLPEPVPDMKQYEKQVHRFFMDHPDYNNYTEVKLSPLPVKSSGQQKEQPARKSILMNVIKRYLEGHHPGKVNRNVRTVLLEYIRTAQAGYPVHFKEIVWDFIELMELLDIAEDEHKLYQDQSSDP